MLVASVRQGPQQVELIIRTMVYPTTVIGPVPSYSSRKVDSGAGLRANKGDARVSDDKVGERDRSANSRRNLALAR
jgi:hypothetical protein